jgi:hypothetical protein
VIIAISRLMVMGAALAASTAAAEASRSPAELDFKQRCRQAGVIRCVGFDEPADFESFRLMPAADGRVRGTRDTSIQASGASSLRFAIPGRSAANAAGAWHGRLGGRFAPGSTLHLQFRQRFSAAMLKQRFEPGDGWKQIIIYGANSCGKLELTTVNLYHYGFPTLYTDCGARNLKQELQDGDILLQQGDYNCHYQGSRPPSECGYYRPDEWMTFYYQVDIGEWGTATSSIQAWMGYAQEPLKQFVNMAGYTLNSDEGRGDGFRQVLLTSYMTNKDQSQVHPTVSTWYDELIVSTRPIAAPALGPSPAQLISAPESAQAGAAR